MSSPDLSRREAKNPGPQMYGPRPPYLQNETDGLLPFARPTKTPNKLLHFALAFWPLIAHGILSTGLAILVTFYIDHRHFNISDRRPHVRLHDDTIVPWTHFTPLQSDITTLLSVLLAIIRLVAAAWVGPLVWRCAFILMEKIGVKPGQLRTMISYGITALPICGRGERGKWRFASWLIWTILLIALPTQLSAPVLTGSITWVAGYHPPERLSNFNFSTSLVGTSSRWPIWSQNSRHRQGTANYAAVLPFLTWGRDTKNDALKRFVDGFSVLEAGNFITNITIPYFTVQSIEWIDDPQLALSASSVHNISDICSRTSVANISCSLNFVGSLALVPDTPWKSQPQLIPSKVSEKRLMVLYAAMVAISEHYCSLAWNETAHLNLVPDSRGIYQEGQAESCYRFAWVTYTAGASTCYSCRLSSFAAVQNDSNLEVTESLITEQALRLMPTVVDSMLQPWQDLMVPPWQTLDEYVVGMLTRSYSASWMALTDHLAPLDTTAYSPSYNATYWVSPPASQALVNSSRVYIWLGLQSLVTLSGVLFIIVQSRTGTLTIIDATLTAFYLDASRVSEFDGSDSVTRRVEYEGECLKVKTE